MQNNMGRTVVIAEAGVNHNGSLDMGVRLIDAAVEAGADIVKFQSFNADELATHEAPKAGYQVETTGDGSPQLEMLRRLELSQDEQRRLFEYAQECGIEFMSTPFDLRSLTFLAEDLNVDRIKIGSGDMTNAPLLHRIGKTGKRVVLSTGMADLAEIRMALGCLALGYIGETGALSQEVINGAFDRTDGRQYLSDHVVLLHCTTAYPAPVESLNLNAMRTLEEAFELPVGFSDHSDGTTWPVVAVVMGAVMLEKHLTLDRDLPGPDHRASLEPADFKSMVEQIRQIDRACGSGEKIPHEIERRNVAAARKSLVALCSIREGDVFTESNLGVKRPGSGRSPFLYWDIIGKRATRNYSRDELIE